MWRQSPVDPERRGFLKGKFGPARPLADAEIAGILVQMLPERMRAVELAISAIPGAEISTMDPSGKMVVVLEAETTDAVGARLHEIAALPGVLTANLAFHATDRA